MHFGELERLLDATAEPPVANIFVALEQSFSSAQKVDSRGWEETNGFKKHRKKIGCIFFCSFDSGIASSLFWTWRIIRPVIPKKLRIFSPFIVGVFFHVSFVQSNGVGLLEKARKLTRWGIVDVIYIHLPFQLLFKENGGKTLLRMPRIFRHRRIWIFSPAKYGNFENSLQVPRKHSKIDLLRSVSYFFDGTLRCTRGQNFGHKSGENRCLKLPSVHKRLGWALSTTYC